MNLVVFDIDGTLVQYHRKRNDAAYVKALSEVFNVTVDDSWSGFVNSTDSGILGEIFKNRLGRKVSAGDILCFKESMAKWLKREYGNDPFEATPGALRIWGELLGHPGWKMAVGTGNFEFAGRFKLGSAGFKLGDTPLGTADDAESREQVLETSNRRACGLHKVHRFGKIVYVGDWIWDAKAAEALGWDFIGIASGKAVQPLRDAGAEIILPDFHHLIPALEAI